MKVSEKKKVLVIDDNNDVRENISELLMLADYHVITAENGQEGINLALDYLPHIIVCDIMMPVLDGYGTIHVLSKNPKTSNIPFIFLSAKTEHADLRKGMELGADDYLSKPFTGTELLNAIESRLKKYELLSKIIPPAKEQVANEQLPFSIHSLTDHAETIEFQKKQKIYKEKQRPFYIYLIIEGAVKAYSTNSDGKELITGIFTKGEIFGFIPIIENTTYYDNTEALTDSTIAVIKAEDFADILHNQHGAMDFFLKLAVENAAEAEKKLVKFAYDSLRKKVANALVTVADKVKDAKAQKTTKLSREELANLAGTATESVIRTLSEFKNEGYIKISDGQIEILQVEKLRNLHH